MRGAAVVLSCATMHPRALRWLHTAALLLLWTQLAACGAPTPLHEAAVTGDVDAVRRWIAAGRPVVSQLPPGNVKARFYVPQAERSSLPRAESLQHDVHVWAKLIHRPVAIIGLGHHSGNLAEDIVAFRDRRSDLVTLVPALEQKPQELQQAHRERL